MRILCVSATYYPATAYGGPTATIRHWVSALRSSGATIDVVTTDANGSERMQLRDADWDGARVRYFAARPLNGYGVSLGLWRALVKSVASYDVVHCHGTNLPSTTVGLWSAFARGVARVVSPHGSMMAWARRRKRWRKRAYAVLDLAPMRGAMFHASSELEGEELRDMGWSRVVVVPHAVNAHEFAGRAELNVREVLGLPSDAKLVVSVSRFDPVKNLMTLVDATEALGVHLVLAGNHQNNYGRTLRRAIEDRRRGDVHAVGYVEGEMKRALLQQANAYVCASLVESYGVSIAEALASGCPVVASTGTPWEGLQQAGAGRWVPPNAGAIRAGLVEVLGGPASQRERARELARKHDWKTRVRPMLDLYRAAIAAAREGQVGPQ